MSTLIYPTVASSLGLEVGPPEARSHGLGLADIFGAARPLSDFDLHSRGDEACGLEDRLLWRKGTYHRGGHLIAMDIFAQCPSIHTSYCSRLTSSTGSKGP